MVIEISTVQQSQPEKAFHTWVSEEELNLQVWEFTIVLNKFYQMLIKHQNLELVQVLKENHSFYKVSVMSDIGLPNSSSNKVHFQSELPKLMEVFIIHTELTQMNYLHSKNKEIESMVTLKMDNTFNISLINQLFINNGNIVF